MKLTSARTIAVAAFVVAASVSVCDRAHAQSTRYPAAASFERYRAASQAEEIALARSAAPPSISADATVLVLGVRGYETAIVGSNGFVCFVERSWAASLDDPEFWNPKIRSPNCFNPPAARTELPQIVKRTEWILAGASREEIVERTRAAIADHVFMPPEPSAMTFMLSKHGYINDELAGPWLPHLMFFVPHGQTAAWGAGLKGSPVLGGDNLEFESTVLFVPVRRWSDGSAAPFPVEEPAHQH